MFFCDNFCFLDRGVVADMKLDCGLIWPAHVSLEFVGHQPRHMDASSMSESQDCRARMIGMWELKTDRLHLQGPWLTLSDPRFMD